MEEDDFPVNPIKEAIAEAAFLFSDPEPSKCHCRGRGYFVSSSTCQVEHIISLNRMEKDK